MARHPAARGGVPGGHPPRDGRRRHPVPGRGDRQRRDVPVLSARNGPGRGRPAAPRSVLPRVEA
ncbi:hypothetical protein MICRO80W_30022 [Micrococcus luteus]|nr:hypothetical protein MICRO80W_30022 [Micrococcus luteus]